MSGCLVRLSDHLSSVWSHLASRSELQRAEGSLEVSSVALEVVESASDGLLKLRGLGVRRAVSRDLAELRGRHFGRCRRWSGSGEVSRWARCEVVKVVDGKWIGQALADRV